jgi:hypothetical protein
MPTPENPDSNNAPTDDSVRLEIRDEVDKRFDNPPASFIRLVEDEVQRRIKRQEWFYARIIGLFFIAVAAFVFTFWHIELSEIPKAVQHSLESEGALAAQKQITNILAVVTDESVKLSQAGAYIRSQQADFVTNLESLKASSQYAANVLQSNLNEIPNSLDTNLLVPLRNRFAELKGQENILTINDLHDIFGHQTLIAPLKEQRIFLNDKPIPETVKISWASNTNVPARWFYLDGIAYWDGTNNIIFTNTPRSLQQAIDRNQNYIITIEYVRNPLR